jgi:hypothetical protein
MKSISFLFVFIISFTLSILILKFFFDKRINFSEYALGEQTVSSFAKDSLGNSIHISEIDSVGLNKLHNFIRKLPKKKTVLILGNSQSHSINQKQNGQINYIEILSKRLKEHKIFGNTYPNASIQDFFISYSFLNSKFPIEAIVIPIFLDDLREINGIESQFYQGLIDEKFRIFPNNNYLTNKINNTFLKSSTVVSNTKTSQDKSEKYINDLLLNKTHFWYNRESANGYLFAKLFQFRNFIFNIDASTKRTMLPERYNDNLKALELLVYSAKLHNIKTFLYIPPIRHDFNIPYDLDQYDQLKKYLIALTKKYPEYLFLKDFDNIVPSQYFGLKLSGSLTKKKLEPDFMHFQYQGHKIISDSILNFLNSNGIK